MTKRWWLVGLAGLLGVAVVLMWQAREPDTVARDALAGWALLEAKPPAGFQAETPEGLAQLVELQLFAQRIAGVQEVRGPLKETLPLPAAFGLPEVEDELLKGAIPLLLRRQRGRWDEAMFLPRLAYLLEQLQARSTKHFAVSLFPSRVPMPPALTAAIPKAQLYLLKGPAEARKSKATHAAFDYLAAQGARVLWARTKVKTPADASALLVLASLSQTEETEAVIIDPAGLDVEAQLKARLPGGLRLQAIGRAGQIHYDEQWMSGPGAKTILEPAYRKKTAGWLSADGRDLLVLVAHQAGLPMPSLKGLTPEPSLMLMPLGKPGEIGFSPFAPRLPALQWERALVVGLERQRHIQSGLVRVYLRLKPKAGRPALDGMEGPPGWGLRLQSPPEED